MAFNTSRQSIDRIRQRYAASGDVKDLPRSGRPRATNRAEDQLITNTTLRNLVLPMLQRRPGGFDNNEVLEAYPSLFKPSGTDSMLLGSSPVFLLRSPVFLRGTEQLAFSLLVITSGGTGNSGERSRSQMRAGFVFDTLTGGYVSGVETGNVTQKSTCSHAMRIMEEASWSGQVWRRTGAPTSLLTGQRYIEEILRPHVVPFLRPMGNNGIFQDDNARPHRARIVHGFLQANNVRRLEWSAMSPDLSCIEHVWDVPGRAVQKRMTEHSTMADLRRFLREEWQRIPQATIRKLVFSTRKRLIECRDNRGGYTHY